MPWSKKRMVMDFFLLKEFKYMLKTLGDPYLKVYNA
jgi:hypothetical protein